MKLSALPIPSTSEVWILEEEIFSGNPEQLIDYADVVTMVTERRPAIAEVRAWQVEGAVELADEDDLADREALAYGSVYGFDVCVAGISYLSYMRHTAYGEANYGDTFEQFLDKQARSSTVLPLRKYGEVQRFTQVMEGDAACEPYADGTRRFSCDLSTETRDAYLDFDNGLELLLDKLFEAKISEVVDELVLDGICDYETAVCEAGESFVQAAYAAFGTGLEMYMQSYETRLLARLKKDLPAAQAILGN